MATLMDEVIIIKPDKMSLSWCGMLKLCVLIVLVFALYTYFCMYIKSLWMQSKQLDRMGMLTIKSDKMMKHIFAVDQDISVSLEELNNIPY